LIHHSTKNSYLINHFLNSPTIKTLITSQLLFLLCLILLIEYGRNRE
jgi:hypothetical protein